MGKLLRVARVALMPSKFTLVLCIFNLMSCSKIIPVQDNESQVKTHSIKIEKFQFQPKTVVVRKGDFVRWENKDIVPHQIAERTLKKWRSKDLLPNDSFTLKIEGTTSYICKLHPNMKAEIVVQNLKK
jgi:plastocyanin